MEAKISVGFDQFQIVAFCFQTLVAFALVAVASAADSDRTARILHSETQDSELPNGKYAFSYETSNGIAGNFQ